jgi:hypothetical protein
LDLQGISFPPTLAGFLSKTSLTCSTLITGHAHRRFAKTPANLKLCPRPPLRFLFDGYSRLMGFKKN